LLLRFASVYERDEDHLSGFTGGAWDAAAPGKVEGGIARRTVYGTRLRAVTGRLWIATIATLDRRHFGVVQPNHLPSLHLLP
jgi:hypothetical protein